MIRVFFFIGISIFASCMAFANDAILEKALEEIQQAAFYDDERPAALFQLDKHQAFTIIDNQVILNPYKRTRRSIDLDQYINRVNADLVVGNGDIIGVLSDEKLIQINTKSAKVTNCSLNFSSWAEKQLVSTARGFMSISQSESSDDTQSTLLFNHFPLDGKNCKGTLLAKLQIKNYLGRFKAKTFRDRIILVLERANVPFTRTDFIEKIEVNFQGEVLNRVSIDGYRAYYPMTAYMPGISVSSKGILIPLYDLKDLSNSKHLYLVTHDGEIRKVASHTGYGFWTENEDIIAARYEYAKDIKFQLLDGTNFREIRVLGQPAGSKSDASYLNGHLYFNNHQRSVGYSFVEIALNSVDSYVILGKKNIGSNFKYARLPKTQTVEYESENGLIPSMLSIPFEKCDSNNMAPAIVYLHGGNSSGNPIGNSDEEVSTNDYLMFAQLGYVVLEANYFGDNYDGPRYQKGGERYAQIEGYDRHLMDIQAAAKYIQSLPCVDPLKIFLFGHSYGAMISSVYLTTPKYNKINPFSGAILRGGIYRDSQLDINISPRIAVRKTEEKMQIDPQNCSERINLYDPEIEIYDVHQALDVLNNLDQSYYGVIYHYPESFYDRIYPVRRAENIHNIPIYLMAGSYDDEETDDLKTAKELEKELVKYNNKIQSWYPVPGGHYFWDQNQTEMIFRIRTFVEN